MKAFRKPSHLWIALCLMASPIFALTAQDFEHNQQCAWKDKIYPVQVWKPPMSPAPLFEENPNPTRHSETAGRQIKNEATRAADRLGSFVEDASGQIKNEASRAADQLGSFTEDAKEKIEDFLKGTGKNIKEKLKKLFK
jgi:hypothetical protein